METEKDETETVYQDNLVSISGKKVVFKHYYFPTGKSKSVRLEDIERIDVKRSTLWNGKWRIHGTGNFKTWFPQDLKRPCRDRIFFARLRGQWVNIGFTVEDADRVEKIFRDRNLLK